MRECITKKETLLWLYGKRIQSSNFNYKENFYCYLIAFLISCHFKVFYFSFVLSVNNACSYKFENQPFIIKACFTGGTLLTGYIHGAIEIVFVLDILM